MLNALEKWWEEWKKMFYGAFLGGIVAWFLLGVVFGWMSSGANQKLVDNAVSEAVVPIASKICVQNFLNDVDFEQHLSKIQEVGEYNWDDYIEDEGSWAVMDGDESPFRGVPYRCASDLKSKYLKKG